MRFPTVQFYLAQLLCW